MNLDEFSKNYTLTGSENDLYKKYMEAGELALKTVPEVQMLLNLFSGAIFDEGLFRVHNKGSFYYWTNLAFEYFKKYKGQSYVFGFDWMGRQFALNRNDDRSLILLLDPATAKVFDLEASIEEFFNIDLADGKKDFLEEDKFKVIKNKLDYLPFDHCIGFIKPLFLGGKYDVYNLEDSDMEVYWEINYQIFCQTKNLPHNTLVNLSIKS